MIESIGRTCYKSEGHGDPEGFVAMLKKRGHLSVLEHCGMTVRFVMDRGISHELVRHRLASYSQESTRYCDYGGSGCTFIIPPWVDLEPMTFEFGDAGPYPDDVGTWLAGLAVAERAYSDLRACGWKPEQARSVLPTALKTEIVMTCNVREWMHVFAERTPLRAHPQIREVMIPLSKEVRFA